MSIEKNRSNCLIKKFKNFPALSNPYLRSKKISKTNSLNRRVSSNTLKKDPTALKKHSNPFRNVDVIQKLQSLNKSPLVNLPLKKNPSLMLTDSKLNANVNAKKKNLKTKPSC